MKTKKAKKKKEENPYIADDIIKNENEKFESLRNMLFVRTKEEELPLPDVEESKPVEPLKNIV